MAGHYMRPRRASWMKKMERLRAAAHAVGKPIGPRGFPTMKAIRKS